MKAEILRLAVPTGYSRSIVNEWQRLVFVQFISENNSHNQFAHILTRAQTEKIARGERSRNV